MGIGIRWYLVPEDGPPLRMSQRLVEGLSQGKDAIPDLANSDQRVLYIVVDSLDREIQAIRRCEGLIWEFDAQGRIEESRQRNLREAMDLIGAGESSTAKVVPLDRKRKHKEFRDRTQWEPSNDVLNVIAKDIWPDGTAKPLKPIKGIGKRPPALTYDAKNALKEASSHFYKIEMALWRLKEPSLKGLAHGAREQSKDNETPELYRAVAEIAERKLQFLARRRSDKGVWYGFVEIFRMVEEGHQEVVATFHRRCNGRTAAEKAARELVALHAQYITADTSINAEVETDLEWEQESRWSTES